MTMAFRYCDGRTVRRGDRVRIAGKRPGIVVEILQRGTDIAKSFSCPEGGVLIAEDWDGLLSYLTMVPPDEASWEDLELVERVDESRADAAINDFIARLRKGSTNT